MKILLVRAKPHGTPREDQFLNGISSIGWPAGSSLIGKQKHEIEAILRLRYKDLKKLHVTEVHLFVTLLEKSIILTPSLENSQNVHIFRTKSDCEYKEEWDNERDGNPHIIQVEFIRTIPKTAFSDMMQRSIRSARKAVSNFTKYRDEIGELIRDPDPSIESKPKNDEKSQMEMNALKTLEDLLDSESDEIRYKAAIAILNRDSSEHR